MGLRLSLIATQRVPVLLGSAKLVGCRSQVPFVIRGLTTSPSILNRSSPPTFKPDSQIEKDSSGKVQADGEGKEKEKAKLSIWQKVKKEAKHYWEGTKLLGYEIRVSTKLALKMASGRELSRREDRQLRRTTQDIARLVPFSVFVLVPFAELLLPVALKIFPNLLPSTYESSKSKNAKSKKLGATRTDVGKYLRDSMQIKELAVPEFVNNEQKKEFDDFFKMIREGDKPSNTQLLNVARMFKDDMLLDNLSRPQLAAMARYINIPGFGTSIILRYQIRHKMRLIKQDDRAIDYEGVDSLNTLELQSACQSRGFKTINVSTGRLREDLSNWLQLRLHDRVPSTFLILSSAYSYGAHDLNSIYDGILSVLGSLPPEAYHETELELQSHEATNAQRLEVLKEQDDLIREENKEEQESGHVVQVRDNLNVDDDEHAPQPSTESEAVVKADQEWYEKADAKLQAKARSQNMPSSECDPLTNSDRPTDAESLVKADKAWADEAGMKKKQNPFTNSMNPTSSEEIVKADLHWADEALKKTEAGIGSHAPTDSEANVKADQSWAESSKPYKIPMESHKATDSEAAVKADQAWDKEK